MFFQLENSLPQSKIIDLISVSELIEPMIDGLLLPAFLQAGLMAIMHLLICSTSVMMALLGWRPTIVSPSRCSNSI